LTGFGGPAAHIAMMEEEVVARRNWLTRQHFLDLVGVTNLIPGPNSTELAIHVGALRAGWAGLCVAGISFILPAVTITSLLAWAYVTLGSLPSAEAYLVGVRPAVLAVIGSAIWRLGRTAVKAGWLAGLGLLVLLLVLAGVNELAAFFLGGVVGTVWSWAARRKASPPALMGVGLGTALKSLAGPSTAALGGLALTALKPSLLQLGLFFFKVGAVLYGSGYVLVVFLRGGLVEQHGWLTEAQLLDAVAVGQFTPGPLLSTATFIGFLLQGPLGAWVASLAVFLPSFVFVALLRPLVPRLRRSSWASGFLDSVNVSALALMLAVALRLAPGAFASWWAWLIGLGALVLSIRWRVNAAWLVLGGALAGWILSQLG